VCDPFNPEDYSYYILSKSLVKKQAATQGRAAAPVKEADSIKSVATEAAHGHETKSRTTGDSETPVAS